MALIKSYRGLAPKWGKDCYFSENATIVGDVTMGNECSVWFNAVVRGDVAPITIGNCTNIQDGSCVHVTHETGPTHIGNYVTIGHNVTVHACTIHDNALIGMGSTLLDGCEIGEGSIVNDDRRDIRQSIRPTCNGKQIIDLDKRVDLSTGEVSVNCDVPGCTHSDPSCKAFDSGLYNDFLLGEEGFYYIKENSLYFIKDGEEKQLIKNEYTTAYAEELFGSDDRRFILGRMMRTGDKLIITGINWLTSYDIKTGERGRNIEVGNGLINDAVITDENTLIVNENNGETYRINMDSGETELLFSDDLNGLCYANGRLYYIIWENGVYYWYSSLPDGSDKRKEMPDASGLFFLVGDTEIYCKVSGRDIIYKKTGDEESVFFNVKEEICKSAQVEDIEYYENLDMLLVKCIVNINGFYKNAYYIYTDKLTDCRLFCEKEIEDIIQSGKEPESSLYSGTYFYLTGSLGKLSETGTFNPLGKRTLKIDGDTMDFVLRADVESSEGTDAFVTDIYAFCEGSFLKIYEPGQTAADKLSVSLKNGSESMIEFSLEIPEQLQESGESLISIIVNLDPEKVVKKGYMLETSNAYICEDLVLAGSGTETVSASENVKTASDEDYFGYRGYGFMDVGSECRISKENPERADVMEENAESDIVISREKENLYIKANETAGSCGRYMICFIDGKLSPVFDGEYCLSYDTSDGTRTLNYRVKKEYLPEEGEHMIQVMRLLPAASLDDMVLLQGEAGKKRYIEVTG